MYSGAFMEKHSKLYMSEKRTTCNKEQSNSLKISG